MRWHVYADVAGSPYVHAPDAERALVLAARRCGCEIDRASVVTIERAGRLPDSASGDLTRGAETVGAVMVEAVA